MTAEEIKLGFLLLQHLRVATRDRAVHKFNVIGRSTRGEFEICLGRDISPSEKQSLIWIWDELKRARLINATGTDLVNPDDWVVVSPKGMTVSEGDFAAMFRDEPSDAGRENSNRSLPMYQDTLLRASRSQIENSVCSKATPGRTTDVIRYRSSLLNWMAAAREYRGKA